MLYLIGLGLGDEKDITVKGLEIIKKCSLVYLEGYTSKLQCSVKDLEAFYGKKIIIARRDDVEKDSNEILFAAKSKDVALLVVGDPMSATTHVDLLLRCKEQGIDCRVIHNASIFNAIGIVGLQLYKFGKTTSIVFPELNYKPETAYDVIKMNKRNGLHTLCLFDLKPEESRYMVVDEAIEILLSIENKRKEKVFTEDTFCIGCARIGAKDAAIKSGKSKKLLKESFGRPPHCLIVPSRLHFMEEDALRLWE